MVWTGPTEPASTDFGEWRIEIRQVGRWTYELTPRRDWVTMTSTRVLGRRRTVRHAHKLLGDLRPVRTEPIAVIGGPA